MRIGRLCAFVIAILFFNFSNVFAAETIWDHNGSTIRWVSDGQKRSAYYLEPRAGLENIGVRPGHLLFEGYRRGNTLEGYMYSFRQGCDPYRYRVSTTLESEREFIFLADHPTRSASCQVVSTKEMQLKFTLIERNEITASIPQRSQENQTPTTPEVQQRSQAFDYDEAQRKMNAKGHNAQLTWTNESSTYERELIYDTCSKEWNRNNYHRQNNPKYVIGGTTPTGNNGFTGNCFLRWSADAEFSNDWNSVRDAEMARCRQRFRNCYIFAQGNVLANWAVAEQNRLKNGSRFASRNQQNNTTAPNNDIDVGGLLEVANALFGIYAASRGVNVQSPQFNNSNQVRQNSACPQIRANYDQCRRQWENIRSIGHNQSGTSGQAGSYKDCMDSYHNAGIAAGCWR